MVMRQRNRLFRAVAHGDKRLEVISLRKSSWLRQLTDADVKAYLNLCAPYIDIHKEGMEIVNEMETKNRSKKAFLDGVQTHMIDNN